MSDVLVIGNCLEESLSTVPIPKWSENFFTDLKKNDGKIEFDSMGEYTHDTLGFIGALNILLKDRGLEIYAKDGFYELDIESGIQALKNVIDSVGDVLSNKIDYIHKTIDEETFSSLQEFKEKLISIIGSAIGNKNIGIVNPVLAPEGEKQELWEFDKKIASEIKDYFIEKNNLIGGTVPYCVIMFLLNHPEQDFGYTTMREHEDFNCEYNLTNTNLKTAADRFNNVMGNSDFSDEIKVECVSEENKTYKLVGIPKVDIQQPDDYCPKEISGEVEVERIGNSIEYLSRQIITHFEEKETEGKNVEEIQAQVEKTITIYNLPNSKDILEKQIHVLDGKTTLLLNETKILDYFDKRNTDQIFLHEFVDETGMSWDEVNQAKESLLRKQEGGIDIGGKIKDCVFSIRFKYNNIVTDIEQKKSSFQNHQTLFIKSLIQEYTYMKLLSGEKEDYSSNELLGDSKSPFTQVRNLINDTLNEKKTRQRIVESRREGRRIFWKLIQINADGRIINIDGSTENITEPASTLDTTSAKQLDYNKRSTIDYIKTDDDSRLKLIKEVKCIRNTHDLNSLLYNYKTDYETTLNIFSGAMIKGIESNGITYCILIHALCVSKTSSKEIQGDILLYFDELEDAKSPMDENILLTGFQSLSTVTIDFATQLVDRFRILSISDEKIPALILKKGRK